MARPWPRWPPSPAFAALLASCSLLRPLDGLTCEPDSTDALCRTAGTGGQSGTSGQSGTRARAAAG